MKEKHTENEIDIFACENKYNSEFVKNKIFRYFIYLVNQCNVYKLKVIKV